MIDRTSVEAVFEGPRFRPEILQVWASVISIEALLIVGYVNAANVRVTNPLVFLYPFVWINVAGWAVARTSPRPASTNRRLAAVTVAGGYLLVLAYFGGLVALESASSPEFVMSRGLPPGYGPLVALEIPPVRALVAPYKVVGYVALSYLVYTAVLDAAGAAFSGLVGIFSCVSCTWPILGTVLTSIFGTASTAVTVATNQPYGISTVVFLSAVGLLVWRPAQ
jgi:hypothetical protein